MNIVIIGGSGLVGRTLAPLLRQAGHAVTSASPSTGVDSVTGKGLPQALAGTDVVVDVTNSPSFEDKAVLAFFETSTRNLLKAEAEAGVRHHVALSVVGSERSPDSGYLRAKVAQEALIQAANVPYTIVRATQFFEFLGAIADAGTEGRTVRVTSAKLQPMAVSDVAAALAKAATEAPLNGTREIGGPEALGLDVLVRRTLKARHDPREVVADPKAPYFGALVDDSTLTPGPQAWLGPTTLDAWLARQPAAK